MNRFVLQRDNKTAIGLSRFESMNLRNKHIDIKYHFVREMVLNGTINLKYDPTTEMVADRRKRALKRQCSTNFELKQH